MADSSECPEMPTYLYRIVTLDDVESCKAGRYTGTKLDWDDKFIHLSTRHQVAGTLERFFADQDVEILKLRSAELDQAALRYDYVESLKSFFPHYYHTVLPTTGVVLAGSCKASGGKVAEETFLE